jgi:glycosyltransferase involved in cell wall biosynthesis
MKISCCIPVLNEPEDQLIKVLHNLTNGYSVDMLEVIIYNDGSCHDDGTPKSLESYNFPSRIRQYLKIIDCPTRFGVGYAFDRASEVAKGEILVLMGSDTLPEKGWMAKVLNACEDNTLNSCCSVGVQSDNLDINKEGAVSRYGASITWCMTHDDLPRESPLRNDPNYREIIGCRWAGKKSDEPYEIDAVYGAWYWCRKSFYQKIHGFDTKVNNHFHGFAYWGHLEGMISIKTKVYNGRCIMHPNIRAGHIFARINQDNVDNHRSVREDFHYWNRLWIARTMLTEELRDECINHMLPCLCYNQAKVWVKHHFKEIQEVRERNILDGNLISK